MGEKTMSIVMFPWFAMGHLTPFLHLSNKLAKKGHKIYFFVPTKTQSKLQHFNLYPDLITFVPISVPHVDGLPPGAETTSDVPFPIQSHIMTAMDNTEKDIELFLRNIKPHFVFFDFTHWIPSLAHRLGIKAIHYCIISSVMISYTLSPARQLSGCEWSESFLMQPPYGFPSSTIKLHSHEARAFAQKRNSRFGGNVLFYDRQFTSLRQSDALAFRTSREIEGPFIDYLEKEFAKPVLLTGPVIPEPPTTKLEENWTKWLAHFNADSVIYCALGSECILIKDQFSELVLGLELSGRPFMAALKPPSGEESVEVALPEGFAKRVEGRGIVHGGWVQQQLILEHPSVGCFVTHCGSGSLSEGLLNKCQLVLLPQVGDQIVNARMMSSNLKVGVEVEKGEEDGLFSKESVCKAIRRVMEKDSEIGEEVRGNHGRLRELLLKKDLESSYLHTFCQRLQSMLE